MNRRCRDRSQKLVKWPVTIEEARRLQETLSERVRLTPLKKKIRTVAGIDAAFPRDRTVAVITAFDYESLTPVEESCCIMKPSFPYVPGYLSFREGPAMLCAIKRLSFIPDILIFDGQGIAHPRRLGIASHMGVILNRPSIGCAKSRLVGEYEEPSAERGASSPLYHNGEVVGAVLRTRNGVKPVFVSPGHLITPAEAVDVVLHCTTRYRLPEPIRAADSLTKKLRRELL